jgi:putative transcriptional regulator
VKSRLRLLRAEREWTQEQLAAAIGVSRQAINALETGRHDPSLDLAFRIASAFNLPIEQVFTNPHERTPS